MADVVITNEQGEVVESPDLEKGWIEDIQTISVDGTIELTSRIYHLYSSEELAQIAEKNKQDQITEESKAFFVNGGKAQMEQDIKDAAAGGNPQLVTFARMAIAPMAANMTNEEAMSVSTLWPEWSATGNYSVDDIVQYNDHLWRCEQAHTSQETWTPDAAPSLWSQIDIADDGIDVWTQPTGAQNAYNKGDRVHYPAKDSPIYESLIDGNTWSPDAYPAGWKLAE